MVDLRFRDFTFCQFFLRRETRKLMEVWVLTKISFSVCSLRDSVLVLGLAIVSRTRCKGSLVSRARGPSG